MIRCAGGLARTAGRVVFTTLLLACTLLPIVSIAPAHAADAIESTRASIEPSADGESLLLSADFAVPLSSQLEDAVNRGLALYFVAEFELKRRRWYWFDRVISNRSLTYRLSYHALTQQYRVVVSGYTQRYARLEDALAAVARIRGWPIAERGDVYPGTSYEAAVRLRLDTSQLPKPFQINAITDRDWNLQSEWKQFTFQLEPMTSAPSPEPSASR